MTIFKLTQIISTATWSSVTKPYICEFPIVLDRNSVFGRMLRTELITANRNERGFSREVEGDKSVDTYEVKQKTRNMADFDNILSEARDICFAHDRSLYRWINFGEHIEYEYGRGVIIGTLKVVAKKTGQAV